MLKQSWLAVFVILALCLGPVRVSGQGVPVDGYAAVVNSRVITVGDVLAFIQPVQEQIVTAYEGEEMEQNLAEAYESGLESLIDRALILEDFAAQEGYLPDRVVDEHINEIIRERFNSDRAAFLEALAKERVTLQEWSTQVKERLIVILSRRQNVADRVIVSPKAVQDVYQERMDQYRIPARIKLRMIVLNKGTTAEDLAVKENQAGGIVRKLEEGEDFAALAAALSEGTKASNGGDWGWIEPKDLRKELVQVVETLDTGEHSDVVDAGEFLYILKVEGRQEASVTPFAEVKPEIEAELRIAEQEELYNIWIDRLRKKHYVKVF